MRVGAIQMNSGADVDANLATADRLLAAAAADDCQLAVLPENFALMPLKGRDKAAHGEQPGEGPIQSFLADVSRRHGLWIIAGSMPLVSPESERVFGACPVFDSRGKQRACYRKIHLFDVKLPDRDEAYQESWSMYPGDDPVTVDTPIGKVGLTICYDVTTTPPHSRSLPPSRT
jgi:nitrilase